MSRDATAGTSFDVPLDITMNEEGVEIVRPPGFGYAITLRWSGVCGKNRAAASVRRGYVDSHKELKLLADEAMTGLQKALPGADLSGLAKRVARRVKAERG